MAYGAEPSGLLRGPNCAVRDRWKWWPPRTYVKSWDTSRHGCGPPSEAATNGYDGGDTGGPDKKPPIAKDWTLG